MPRSAPLSRASRMAGTASRDRGELVDPSRHVLAGGRGAFRAAKARLCPGYDTFLGRGVHYAVKQPSDFAGQAHPDRGGRGLGPRLGAHPEGPCGLVWPWRIAGTSSGPMKRRLRSCTRRSPAARSSSGSLRRSSTFAATTVFEGSRLKTIENQSRHDLGGGCGAHFPGIQAGSRPDQGLGARGRKNRVKVGRVMETNLPGIYAAGDLVDYEGKLDLIATGFAEAATAVNNAVRFVDPSRARQSGALHKRQGVSGGLKAGAFSGGRALATLNRMGIRKQGWWTVDMNDGGTLKKLSSSDRALRDGPRRSTPPGRSSIRWSSRGLHRGR
jgi:hypothetical protein